MLLMQEHWWENFFHGVALDFWRAAISDEQTRAEADFIAKQLLLTNSAKVLDVPCGNGRLAIELAKRGFELSGVDIATEFVIEAKRNSIQAGVNIEWHNQDMRNLPWPGEFDGAFCFGNSFGYLDDEANADFLKAISQTLKPGRRFILDAPAIAECVLPTFQSNRSIEIAGIKVDIEHRYDHEQGRMFNDFTFTRNGVVDKRPSSQRIYTYHELTELLREARLEPSAASASLTEEPFKLGAQRLLLVAEKQ
ncbi:MAG: SAM-dependent methyltransferase [Pyrinomonadaceae bacterium]